MHEKISWFDCNDEFANHINFPFGHVNPFQNGDVEAWDEPHDIVGMEELSHDIYDDVQIEQIDEH
jgi:hypothetical protein